MLDLEAIRERSDAYEALADKMVGGQLPDLSPTASASAIGLSASLTAADVPGLITEVEKLRRLWGLHLTHVKAVEEVMAGG